METKILNNGCALPMLGLGVYMVKPGQCTQNVRQALELGYRHIDTAQIYGNEAAVGDGIRSSGISREEIFLTSKVWVSNYGYHKTRQSIERSLNRLQTDYLDLMLLHRPYGATVEAWQALEEAVRAGKIRSIGLSNFEADTDLDPILKAASITPAVNQIELHPYRQCTALREKLAGLGIAAEAWYPLGHGDAGLLKDQTIVEIARNHGKSTAQIILRWHIQNGVTVFPKSTSPAHLKSNLGVFDFTLTPAEMARMAALNREESYYRSFPPMDWLMFHFARV